MPTYQRTGDYPVHDPVTLMERVRQMVMETLEEVGGKEYLLFHARNNPKLFLPLLAKVLPKDVNVTTTVTLEALVARSRVLEAGLDVKRLEEGVGDGGVIEGECEVNGVAEGTG